MHGTIVNFRLGKHTQRSNYMVIKLEGISTKKDAEKTIGKTAVWKTETGKEIKGKITSPHGNTGAVRVLFEKGMPGQSVAGKIEVL
jgi:large subunit ribosomal protein L35Ae